MSFFHGLSVPHLLKEPVRYTEVRERLLEMCPVDGSSMPWIEGCVMSYNTTTGVCYQMFDTTLALNDT